MAIHTLYMCFFLCMSTRSHDYKRFNGVKVVIVCACAFVYVALCRYAYILMYAMSPEKEERKKNSFSVDGFF